MTTPPQRTDLTDAEVDDLCAGLRQNAAKARWLRQMGLTVHTRPNGRPLVMRAHAQQVLAGQLQPVAANDAGQSGATRQVTNRAGLIELFGRRAA